MPKRDKAQYNRYMKKYMLKRYHERRAQAFLLLGSKCTFCGATVQLEIDHIDASQKSFPISKLRSVSKKRYLAELEKCQLLCKDCHVDKSIKERGLQRNKGVHGHLMNYKRYGCRCDDCTEANRLYHQALRDG